MGSTKGLVVRGIKWISLCTQMPVWLEAGNVHFPPRCQSCWRLGVLFALCFFKATQHKQSFAIWNKMFQFTDVLGANTLTNCTPWLRARWSVLAHEEHIIMSCVCCHKAAKCNLAICLWPLALSIPERHSPSWICWYLQKHKQVLWNFVAQVSLTLEFLIRMEKKVYQNGNSNLSKDYRPYDMCWWMTTENTCP